MLIILFGIQGSGKGTQGKLLSEKLGIPHLSTGEVLRAIASEDTPEGRELKAIMEGGVYLDDTRMTTILKQHLPRDCILDGYPRTLNQAQLLDSIASVDIVLYINLHEEEAVRRVLGRGRSDDTPDAVRKRIQQYHASEDAIITYYDKQGKLREIDGDQSIEAVFAAVCTMLGI
jgi:adenylate kinase